MHVRENFHRCIHPFDPGSDENIGIGQVVIKFFERFGAKKMHMITDT